MQQGLDKFVLDFPHFVMETSLAELQEHNYLKKKILLQAYYSCHKDKIPPARIKIPGYKGGNPVTRTSLLGKL